MGLVNVNLDTSKLSKWAEELSAGGFRNALRRAIDQSARAARKVTIDAIAKDIGVSKSAIKTATPKIRTTTAGNLSASFTVTKLRIGIMNVSGATVCPHHGFSRSLRARIAGANEPSRQAWLDRHRHQLWGIVSICRRISRLNARDACVL
jgi:hypothetical protein